MSNRSISTPADGTHADPDGISLLAIAIALLIAWNYWLPYARAYIDEQNSRVTPPNVDFHAYDMAGKAFALGLSPYVNNARNESFAAARNDGYPAFIPNPFIYPPTLLPVYAVFARLEYRLARVLWTAAGLLSHFCALGVLLLASSRRDRLGVLAAGLLLTFTSDPLLYHVRQGQIDVIVASLVVASFVSYASGLKWLSALLLALTVLMKVSPVLFLATFVLFFRDIKYLAQFAVTLTALFCVSLFFVPMRLYVEYATLVLPHISAGASHFSNQSLIRFVSQNRVVDYVENLQSPASNTLMPRLISLSGFALLGLSGWWLGRSYGNQTSSEEHTTEIDFAGRCFFLLNVLTLLLFSGISWRMSYVWVILPVSLVVVGLVRRTTVGFVAMIAPALTMLNARISPPFPLNALNMLGALWLAVCLTIALFGPRSVLNRAFHAP